MVFYKDFAGNLSYSAILCTDEDFFFNSAEVPSGFDGYEQTNYKWNTLYKCCAHEDILHNNTMSCLLSLKKLNLILKDILYNNAMFWLLSFKNLNLILKEIP